MDCHVTHAFHLKQSLSLTIWTDAFQGSVKMTFCVLWQCHIRWSIISFDSCTQWWLSVWCVLLGIPEISLMRAFMCAFKMQPSNTKLKLKILAACRKNMCSCQCRLVMYNNNKIHVIQRWGHKCWMFLDHICSWHLFVACNEFCLFL